MTSKEKITSFFHPISKKDSTGNIENDSAVSNTNEITPVKRKHEDDTSSLRKKRISPNVPFIPETHLSPEQKERCSHNKLKAQQLLLCKKLPLLTPNIGPSWFSALSDVFGQAWFDKLSSFVTNERFGTIIYPEQKEVWEWTTRTRIEDTKVVILGQDPYHGPGQAHGLCFSVKPGIPPPPSLINIYKELETDVEGFSRPSHGCLAGWADQGVLLLNSVLTVRKGQANSHKDKGWEKLTDAVISWISKHLSGVVFLLWGSPAQKKAMMVDKSKHHLLKSVHPSPLSAYRGFLGCKHFSQCNKLLIDQGKEPINWSSLPSNLA